ncbi:alpha/beta hydrolase-fold protein [Bernardetia sp. ABR2-2B]|uniref:alpha/beta hydrolase n=1 Tax=Bernardetia sp. ABR2-2B TaxID=3127472 RepID=UPI0030D2FFDC
MRTLKTLVLTLFLFLMCASNLPAQIDTCFSFNKHIIHSEPLQEDREFWVSLPMNYDSTQSYPVMYVLDAEWRFDLIRNVAYDLSGNKKLPHHIIIGVPHIDWEYKRGQDLTFSQSRIEYDGEAVDSTWYNEGNSGKGESFYQYLKEELIKSVDENYATNGQNVLVGHSYGGYFGAYLLSQKQQPFSKMLVLDPSIWYSDGETIKLLEKNKDIKDSISVYIGYQPEPAFHAKKIEELIELLKKESNISLSYSKFENETHNSLYLFSFLEGILRVYED